jgi:hypothetical protein
VKNEPFVGSIALPMAGRDTRSLASIEKSPRPKSLYSPCGYFHRVPNQSGRLSLPGMEKRRS